MKKKTIVKIGLINHATVKSINDFDKIAIVKRFTETAIKILGADCGFAWWKLSKSDPYKLAYKSRNIFHEPNPSGHQKGYKALKQGAPVFISNAKSTRSGQKQDVGPKIKSYVVIPVAFQKQSYGNIIICFKQHKAFTSEEKSLCDILGKAMAQAITINKLHSDLKNFKSTLDKTLDSIFIFDPNTFQIEYINRGAHSQLGYTSMEFKRRTILDIQDIKSQEKFSEVIKPLKNLSVDSILYETILITKEGGKVPAELFLQYINTQNKGPRFLAIARDITDRKKAEEIIKLTAYQDPLTKLPNRLAFNEKILDVYNWSKTNKKNFAILLMDLDRFKFINDILGHPIGDKLLQEAASRLRSGIKKRDFTARLGGDEFIVIMENIQTEDEVLAMAQRIQDEFKAPFELENHEIYVNSSIGLSIYPDDGKDISILLKNADNALYRAKERGGNSFQQYSEEGGMVLQSSHYEIEKGLRKALKNKELELFYQPQVDVLTGRVIGSEALVRWNHPQLGLIAPNEFITQAEESSLIIPMGEWILEQACKQNKQWQDMGLAYIPVSVNISPKQLLQKGFVETMHRVLKETELDPHYLELEIIEGVVMKNIEMSVEILNQFKDIGIKVLVDDFGTGYASLSYLKRLPIDAVKIDKSFIDGSLTDSDDAALVVAIISIAHQLRLKVIAEGVETIDQYNFLASHRCDYIQGFLYSKPVSAGEFTELLKAPLVLPNVGSKQYTIEK